MHFADISQILSHGTYRTYKHTVMILSLQALNNYVTVKFVFITRNATWTTQ
jgi:hypothetical protein